MWAEHRNPALPELFFQNLNLQLRPLQFPLQMSDAYFLGCLWIQGRLIHDGNIQDTVSRLQSPQIS
jgi:hypothetical protein